MKNACEFRPEGLNSEQMRMIQRVQQGFHCSEILLFAGLEAQGKTNADLVRAVSALAGGIGFTGDVCGALTGGACLLGLYGGRGDDSETAGQRLNIMVSELMDWFSSKYGTQFGGIKCREITEDDPKRQPERCPLIVAGVLKKVKTLLSDNGFEWEQTTPLPLNVGAKLEGSDSTQSLSRSSCPCASSAL